MDRPRDHGVGRWGARARWWHSPAVHFVVLGATVFALDRAVLGRVDAADTADRTRDPSRITLGPTDVARLEATWRQETGTPPDAATRARLVADAIEEEILVREAIAADLHRKDRVVRARLVQLAQYLELSGEDDAALEAGARAIGLDRRDPIVRRHLAQTMRLLLARPGPGDLPNERALRDYFAAHAEELREPATLRLTHVYLRSGPDDDRRREASDLLARLRAGAVAVERAPTLGDPFASGGHVGPASETRLRALFGPGFAEALEGLAPGAWSEPVASTYGIHLVWLHERAAGSLPPLDAVRSRIVHRVLRERGQERLRRSLARLADRYEVRVSPAAEPASTPAAVRAPTPTRARDGG